MLLLGREPLVTMLPCLFRWVWYTTCFLKRPPWCSFSEQREGAGWLCCLSVYDTITSRAMRVIWDECSVPLSCPYLGTTFGNPLIIVHSLWGEQERILFPSFPPPFPPSGLLQQFLRIFNFPWILSTQSTWQKFAWSVPWPYANSERPESLLLGAN